MDVSKVWNLLSIELPIHGGVYSEMKVCNSQGGYYIGRVFRDGQFGDIPGSRESDYFATRVDAEIALSEGFTWRNSPENIALYEDYFRSLKDV